MTSRNPTEFLNSVLLYPGPSEIPYGEDMKWTIRQHILDLLQEFEGMCIKLKNYTRPDARVVLLLVLEGTLPIYYRGTRYNIPVVVWLPEKYPRQAPYLYVTPTPDMLIKPSHSFVDSTGLVRSLYVNSWAYPRSNLNELAHDTAIQFGTEPPLFSKPPNWSSAHAQNVAAAAVAAGAAHSHGAAAQQQQQQHPHQHHHQQQQHQQQQQQQQRLMGPPPPPPPPAGAQMPAHPPPPPVTSPQQQQQQQHSPQPGPSSVGSGAGAVGGAAAGGHGGGGDTVQVHNPLQQGQSSSPGAFSRLWGSGQASSSSPAQTAAAGGGGAGAGGAAGVTSPAASGAAAGAAAAHQAAAAEPPAPSRQELLDAFRQAAIDTLTRRLRARLRQERGAVDAEVRELLEVQEALRQKGAALDRAVTAAAAERDALERSLAEMAVRRVEMESWLEDYEAKVPASIDDVDPDAAIAPADELSRQALEAHSLDLAIEECLYALDKALQRGTLQPEVYLKQVRQLCRKQYYARALGNKVAARQQRAAAAMGRSQRRGLTDESLQMPQGDSWVATGVLPNPLAAMR